MSFLVENGYKNYETKEDNLGIVNKYQKRVDTQPGFDYPLCQCNDKLFLHVEHYKYVVGEQDFESYEMYLVHENYAGNWCDLKIYSLNEEDIKKNLSILETKLLDMWRVFNE